MSGLGEVQPSGLRTEYLYTVKSTINLSRGHWQIFACRPQVVTLHSKLH